MRIEPATGVKEEPNLHLPRILCLHGGGTNARIFRAQCRGIVKQLQNEFRFVFAQAPFPSSAGPDVLSVYSEWGPFRRWLRSPPEHPQLPSVETATEIDNALEDAMQRDDAEGATGEWVALLGFSQGAKLAASLLYWQQQCRSKTTFRFGILLAGSAPLVWLSEDLDAKSVSQSVATTAKLDSMVCIPTVHVHGLRDPGLQLHRQLREEFCQPDVSRLIEWDGDHRVPAKSKDVLLVVQQIRELEVQTGRPSGSRRF